MPGPDLAVTKVVCGDCYTLVLCENGNVYSWGIGKSGSLGLGELHTVKTVPTRISFPLEELNTDEEGTPPKMRGSPDKDGPINKIVAIASG